LQAEIAQTRALLARAGLVEVLRQCRFAAERQNRLAPWRASSIAASPAQATTAIWRRCS